MSPGELPPKAKIYAENPGAPRVFLAEDDQELRSLFGQSLRRAGFEVLAANDGAELLSFLSAVAQKQLPRPDVIVMDVRMPSHSGMDLLVAMRFADWDVPTLLMTAFADDQLRLRAEVLGARVVLDKPLAGEDLVAAVRRAAGRAP